MNRNEVSNYTSECIENNAEMDSSADVGNGCVRDMVALDDARIGPSSKTR